MAEAEDKFGKKGRTNAALTLGIIGTALGAFAGNNGGCGCGNGGGLLGNLFGGNNNCCAMQQAEQAKTLAMAQGQQANDLAWSNRVQSLQDDIDLYTYINGRNLATNERIGNETQVLTNQIWKGRVQDLQEKSGMYVDIITRDNTQNMRLCDELYKRREQDIQEKTQPILDEINREVGSLSLDEQKVLATMQEYQMAKSTYEAGFMAFLGNKFSQEYVASPDGKIAADNLLATIRKSKEHIHAQLKAKEDKVNTLLELVEQDPEIKKRLDEVMLNKNK